MTSLLLSLTLLLCRSAIESFLYRLLLKSYSISLFGWIFPRGLQFWVLRDHYRKRFLLALTLLKSTSLLRPRRMNSQGWWPAERSGLRVSGRKKKWGRQLQKIVHCTKLLLARGFKRNLTSRRYCQCKLSCQLVNGWNFTERVENLVFP